MDANVEENSTNSGSSLVAKINAALAAETDASNKANELKEACLSDASARKEQALNQIAEGLAVQSKKLRETAEVFIGSGEEALVHHFGERLVNKIEWSQIVSNLEESLRTEAEKHDFVPVLIRYPREYGAWDEPTHRETEEAFLIIPREFILNESGGGSRLFESNVVVRMSLAQAFSNKEIPVLYGRLSLRALAVDDSTGCTENSSSDNAQLFCISNYHWRQDGGASYSFSDYAYSDSEDSIISDIDTYDDRNNNELKIYVGFDGLLGYMETRVESGVDREKVILDLQSLFQKKPKMDFENIDHPLAKLFVTVQLANQSLDHAKKHRDSILKNYDKAGSDRAQTLMTYCNLLHCYGVNSEEATRFKQSQSFDSTMQRRFLVLEGLIDEV